MQKSDETISQRLMLSLWSNWTITALCFIAVLGVPFLINKTIIPLVVVFLAYLLLNYSRRLSVGSVPRCALMARIGMISLFWTALIMSIINLLNSRELFNHIFEWSNVSNENPYINCLILFPILVLLCAWQIVRGYDSRACRNCKLHSGLSRINNVVTAIYSRESRYQMQLLLSLSLVISVVEWWYYFNYYININQNNPDRFFFNVMPIVLLSLSIYLVKGRYANMALIIGPLTRGNKDIEALARVIVISGDYILLEQNSNGRWDTPTSINLSSVSKNDIQTFIENEFRQAADLVNTELRYLYKNKSYDMLTSIYHYAAVLPDGQNNGSLPGKWFSIEKLDLLIRTAKVSTEITDEIYRIYTITMAWKTYDREGKRLYPIKQYRPSFNLRDFKEWNVDYSDTAWFDVADNNEDSRFWHTRRFFKKLIAR